MFLPTTDVFVIGGGPAGLAAAIAARRRGFQVTVADCARPPVDKACGEGLMPDGLRAAQSLGIELEMAMGRRFCGIRFCDGDISAEARFPSGYGLGMRRTTLHQRLAEMAAETGVRLHWGATVTGIGAETVSADGSEIRARWIIGADGGQSRVRRWAGLEAFHRNRCRYGFRLHYRIEPWSDWMEIYWGDGCQIYVTPTAEDEICLAVISADPHLRLSRALPRFPAVMRRLAGAQQIDGERGGVSASRRLKRVYNGCVALVGDASGSVDAITGEGLYLLFQQSAALAEALESGDLHSYQKAHRRIGRQPEIMAKLMLILAGHDRLRHRAIAAMAADPRLFAAVLAAHIREISPARALAEGAALGWRMLAL